MYKLPATIFCILLICYLFWIDRKNKEDVSNAVWIPFLSLLFHESRPLSFWLGYFFGIGSGTSIEEGSPIEATFQTILLVVGIIVLSKRHLQWGEIFKKNKLICLYFFFGLVSISWSDFPFVAFKRLIKTSGTIIMALIILTEERPFVALGTIIRRLSFIFLPLSIIFIKYYPELGREYHQWAGTQMFTGVSSQKNGLGQICLYAGIYFSWNMLFSHRYRRDAGKRLHISIYLVLLPMLAWLFYIANSATPFVCFIVAVSIFAFARQPWVRRTPFSIIFITFVCIILFAALEWAFEIKDTLIAMLGRRPDLTTRVPMWDDLLSMVKNPLIGFGYESFWLGDRLIYVQSRWGDLIQAHNGYIETYLNLGSIGLFLLIIWILSGFKKIATNLIADYLPALFRFCLLIVVCLYNYTEATFYGKGLMWLFFLLATIDVSRYSERI